MATTIVDELGRIPMSRNLAASLSRASSYAQAQLHREVTLEHLLLALTEDPDAGQVLEASRIDLHRLNGDVSGYIGRIEDRNSPENAGQLVVSAELKRILEAAAAAALKGRRREINGAIVLAAVVGDGRTAAAHMLRAQGLTFEEAIRVLQRAATPAAPRQQHDAPVQAPVQAPAQMPAHPSMPTSEEGQYAETAIAAARERVQRNWVETPAAVPKQDVAEPEPREVQPRIEAASAQPVEVPVRPHAARGATADEWQPEPGPQPPQTPPAVPAPPPPRDEAPTRSGVFVPREPLPMPRPAAEPQHPQRPQSTWAPPPQPPPGPQPPSTPLQRVNRPLPPPLPDPRMFEPRTSPPYPPRPAPAPGMPPPLPGAHGSGGGPGGAPITSPPTPPWQSSSPAPREPFANVPPTSPASQHRTARDAPPRGGALVRTESRPEGRRASSVEIGQLIENIPRTMRVGIASIVEIRIAKADVKALAEGLQGGGAAYQHEILVTKAMSVRLRAPDGGFFIEGASPETQWIDNALGLMADDYASWRWAVTPKLTGRRRLQLIVAARTVAGDGVAAETALPDQVFEIRVRTNYARAARQVAGWIVAAVVGGALSKFGEQIMAAGSKIVASLMSMG